MCAYPTDRLNRESSLLQKVRTPLEQALEVDLATLGREELRSLDIEVIIGFLARYQDLLGQLSEAPLEAADASLLSSLRQAPTAFLNCISEVRQLVPTFDEAGTPDEPTSKSLAQVVGNIESRYAAAFGQIAPFLGYFRSRRLLADTEAELQRRTEAVRAELGAKMAEYEAQLARIRDAGSEAESAVESIRKSAAEAGVLPQAKHFKSLADANGKSASRWFAATIATAVLTLIVAVTALVVHLVAPRGALDDRSFQISLTQVIVLSVLFFMVLLFARTFRALRHNEIVNRHREKALSTFEALSDASDDESTRNLVLLEATRAIFAHQQSGYVAKEQEPTSIGQIIELVTKRPSSGGG